SNVIRAEDHLSPHALGGEGVVEQPVEVGCDDDLNVSRGDQRGDRMMRPGRGLETLGVIRTSFEVRAQEVSSVARAKSQMLKHVRVCSLFLDSFPEPLLFVSRGGGCDVVLTLAAGDPANEV